MCENIEINKNQQKIIDKIEKIDNEKFVPIQGFDDYYISDQGRIWSCKTNIFLKGYKDRNIYKIYLDDKKFTIHILVAKHFIPNHQKKTDVIHLGNFDDNRAIMLQWATRSENRAYIAKNKSKENIIIDHEKVIKNIPNKKEGEIFVQITHPEFGLYDNYYISNQGNLWNSKMKTMTNGYKDITGYYRTSLSKIKGNPKSVFIHRLVACHFIPNPENKKEVNHLGEKHQNSYDMLEWNTHQENINHSAKNKLNFFTRSVQKLNPQTLEIIETYPCKSKIEGHNINGINKSIKEKTIYNGFIWKNTFKINNENLEDEVWVLCDDSIYDEVNEYPNYRVSNKGRIKSQEDNIMSINNRSGTSLISLTNGITRKSFKVHRLVIMAFNKENPENKQEVDHIDSNRLNNCLENLRWADREDQLNNIESRKKLQKPRPSRNKQIKVTYDDVTQIYYGLQKLSEKLKINKSTIHKYSDSGKEYKGYKFEFL